jgi:hypothetical protein
VAYTGSAELSIGAGATTRSNWSQGKVVLNSNVRVEGSVRSASTINRNSTASVTGTIEEGAALSPTSTLSWKITLPSAGSSINVPGGTTRTLAPASYGSISVKTNGRLKLSAGKYGSPARLVGSRRSRSLENYRRFQGRARVGKEQVESARSEGQPGGSYANQKALRPCAPRLYSSSCLV